MNAAVTVVSAFDITVINPNNSPLLSGVPATTINEDVNYSFTPTATDANGDTLTYSITGMPQVGQHLMATTGELSGIPENADVGSYSNIIISVSDGEESVS